MGCIVMAILSYRTSLTCGWVDVCWRREYHLVDIEVMSGEWPPPFASLLFLVDTSFNFLACVILILFVALKHWGDGQKLCPFLSPCLL